jgi:hypothetical protein
MAKAATLRVGIIGVGRSGLWISGFGCRLGKDVVPESFPWVPERLGDRSSP